MVQDLSSQWQGERESILTHGNRADGADHLKSSFHLSGLTRDCVERYSFFREKLCKLNRTTIMRMLSTNYDQRMDSQQGLNS
jgi:hypothetical protein